MDDAIRDCELDVTAGKGHAVDTLGVGMIVRTGIQRKNLHEGGLLVGGETLAPHLREIHFQRFPLCLVGETATGIRVGIGIGDIGLHIVDGCAIHKVGTQNVDNALFHPGDTHTR